MIMRREAFLAHKTRKSGLFTIGRVTHLFSDTTIMLTHWKARFFLLIHLNCIYIDNYIKFNEAFI
jgi:hypothetical protein